LEPARVVRQFASSTDDKGSTSHDIVSDSRDVGQRHQLMAALFVVESRLVYLGQLQESPYSVSAVQIAPTVGLH
jgi:hypothetical protein